MGVRRRLWQGQSCRTLSQAWLAARRQKAGWRVAISHQCPMLGSGSTSGSLGTTNRLTGLYPGDCASREAQAGPVLWQAVHGRAEG